VSDEFLVAGVDGGGSKTECAIVDQDGHVVGVGRGGPSNLVYTRLPAVLEAFGAAVQSATAGLSGHTRVALTACTHRAGSHPDVQALLTRMLGGEVRRYTEGEAALGCAGIFERFGIAHIAGTGASTFGFSRDGREIMVGGWGMLVGDEGGGYDIAVSGLRAAVRAMDGRGPHTSLLERACRHFGLATQREAFIGFSITAERHVVASFAPEVTAAAREGDHAAEKIVEDAVREHADSILAVAGRLFGPDEVFPVALHGGVMSERGIAKEVARLVRERFPKADVRLQVHSPGVGLALFALWDVRAAAGRQLPHEEAV